MHLKLNALLKAVETHEEGKSKLTTYLYNGVRQQCISAVKFNNRYSKRTGQLHDNISDPKASGNLVDLYDEIDNIPNGEMLKDRMLSHTIDDVAKKHNLDYKQLKKRFPKTCIYGDVNVFMNKNGLMSCMTIILLPM